MKKVISSLLSIILMITVFSFTGQGKELEAKIYNAFSDFDAQYSDGRNGPWQYMYSSDGGQNFLIMGKLANNLGLKWYPKDDVSYMTAIGNHNVKAKDEVLILDARVDNTSFAALAFVAPEEGLYRFTSKVEGNVYSGQHGESFFIYKDDSQITSIPFGEQRNVDILYSLPGAIHLEKGQKFIFYQKSTGQTHHSAFFNAVVEGPLQNFDGEVIKFDNPVDDNPADNEIYNYSNLVMTPGVDINHLNFSWHNARDRGFGIIQVAKKESMVTEYFPAHMATTHFGDVTSDLQGIFKNEVTVDDLLEDTEYIYRISSKDSNSWSSIYSFKTGKKDDFGFVVLGDPQLGERDDIKIDEDAWNNILNKSINSFDNADFILSTGNLVQLSSSPEQYNSIFKPNILKSYPFASAIGTSDVGSLQRSYYFNNPNETENAMTLSGSNYYFSYGNTLFVVLNTNIINPFEHRETLRKAVASHENAKWKVVIMHHSIYSAGYWYAHAGFTLGVRDRIAPLMDDFGIDVVFNGRDHAYSRSHFIYDNEISKDYLVSSDGNPIYPEGTVYITASTSTGSLYFELTDILNEYVAVQSQPLIPTYTTVDVTDDYFQVKTLRSDNDLVVDTLTIQKAVYNADDLLNFIDRANEFTNPGVGEMKWKEFVDARNIAKFVSERQGQTSDVYNTAFKQIKDKWDNIVSEVLDKLELSNMYRKALNSYENSIEGDAPGQFPEGSRAELLKIIEKTEDVLSSNQLKQLDIDEMLYEISEAVSIFERQRVKLREISEDSIIYRAYDEFDELKSDGEPWQYLFTFGDGMYEPLPGFDLNGWRAVAGNVWAGIALNPEVPEKIEFNTGHSGDHIGVLAFVAPEDGIYTINEFDVKSNLWQQKADGFNIYFESSKIHESKFSELAGEIIVVPEYTIEMHKGEKIYFYVTRATASVSAYADIVIEQLVFNEEDSSTVNYLKSIIAPLSVSLILLVLGGYVIMRNRKKIN